MWSWRQPERPARWRFECHDRTLTVRIDGQPVLAFEGWEPLARCERFDVRRSPSQVTFAPPLRSSSPVEDWPAYWSTLLRDPALLGGGEWLLDRCASARPPAVRGGSPPASERDFVLDAPLVPHLPHDDAGDIAFGSLEIFPWRALSPPDDGRVKAWRKLARAGRLPPLLLRFEPILYAFILIDGHDRLAAARAERVAPECLMVTAARLTTDGAWRARSRVVHLTR